MPSLENRIVAKVPVAKNSIFSRDPTPKLYSSKSFGRLPNTEKSLKPFVSAPRRMPSSFVPAPRRRSSLNSESTGRLPNTEESLKPLVPARRRMPSSFVPAPRRRPSPNPESTGLLANTEESLKPFVPAPRRMPSSFVSAPRRRPSPNPESTGLLANTEESLKPFVPAPRRMPSSFVSAPRRKPSVDSESSSRLSLQKTFVNDCMPSSPVFSTNKGLELSKKRKRNSLMRNSIFARRCTSLPLLDLASDSDEENSNSAASSTVKYSRSHSPINETSVDYRVSSSFAHHNGISEWSNHQDDDLAFTPERIMPEAPSTSLSFDTFFDWELETSPPPKNPKLCACGKHEVPPRSPLTPSEIEFLPRFKGVKQVSLGGKHDVLVYSIPGTDTAYVFHHGRTNVHYQVFNCVYCWKYRVKTSIRVSDDQFLEDPCKLDHICFPVNELEDRVERLTHKVIQWLTDLREKSGHYRNSPKELHANFLVWLRDESDKHAWTRRKLVKTFKKSGGFKEHEKLFATPCKPKKVQKTRRMRKYHRVQVSKPEELQELNFWNKFLA